MVANSSASRKAMGEAREERCERVRRKWEDVLGVCDPRIMCNGVAIALSNQIESQAWSVELDEEFGHAKAYRSTKGQQAECSVGRREQLGRRKRTRLEESKYNQGETVSGRALIIKAKMLRA